MAGPSRSEAPFTAPQEPANRSGSIPADVVREQLEKILSSPGFVKAELLSRFLRFIVEQTLAGETGQLKEIVIGVEVFGRKPGYDPRSDSIVRVQAGKLRSRLGEYYYGLGKNDPIGIHLASGGYVPDFRRLHETNAKWPLPRRRSVAIVIGAIAIIAISGTGLWSRFGPRPRISSIVVVPFVNLTSDSENEYFSNGITEQLISALAKVQDLRVISQTTSFALKAKQYDVREIGARLNVAAVLEGSVQKTGDRLRITAQLIRVADDSHLWAQTYDREMRSVFDIEDDISRSIINELRARIPTGPGKAPLSRYTNNVEAYHLYLKGRYLWDRRRYKESLRYLEQATTKDAYYALAQAALAASYIYLGVFSELPPERDTFFARARDANDAALRIDPLLPEANVWSGALAFRDRDWGEAERKYRRAIELDPNSALPHQQYGGFLANQMARTDEGLLELRRAESLDPLSVDVGVKIALALLTAGRYDEALNRAKQVSELDPSAPIVRALVARCYLQKRMYAAAITLLESESTRPSSHDALLAYAYALSGRPGAVQRILTQLTNRPTSVAYIYTGLGDFDRAFEWIDRADRERSPLLLNVKNWPEFAPLRSDPRYAALMKKLKLPG
jgi:TolB-like protein/Tfp pilus assembly protein PilF